MERRLSIRKQVNVSVYLSCAGQRLARCTASDISGAGVFVKTNPLFVPRNEQLKLIFALQIKASNVIRLRQVPARATRFESDGVGMVFCGKRKNRDKRVAADPA